MPSVADPTKRCESIPSVWLPVAIHRDPRAGTAVPGDL